jgi:hypothetical protein
MARRRRRRRRLDSHSNYLFARVRKYFSSTSGRVCVFFVLYIIYIPAVYLFRFCRHFRDTDTSPSNCQKPVSVVLVYYMFLSLILKTKTNFTLILYGDNSIYQRQIFIPTSVCKIKTKKVIVVADLRYYFKLS